MFFQLRSTITVNLVAKIMQSFYYLCVIFHIKHTQKKTFLAVLTWFLIPLCLNPDSIEHTFLYCQESKEFFSKTLRWFNEYHKENVQLSNKQILFNTFDDSLPMQMPISTQRKLRLLVLLQKKYLYTCKNIVTKPNLEEFLRKLFEQYRIENCGKQY